MTKKFLPELESVRGLAAMTVLLEHWISFGPESLEQSCQSIWTFSIMAAHLAVLVFFVLSGFVLTHVLFEDRDAAIQNVILRFWIRRIFRIYPLAIVVVLAAFLFFGSIDRFVVSLAHWSKYSDFRLWRLFTNMMLMTSGLNTPGWTLKYEVFGYALLPFCFAAIQCRNIGKVIAVALFVVGYGLLCRISSSWIYLSPGFAVGLFVCLAWRSGDKVKRGPLVFIALMAVAFVAILLSIRPGDIFQRSPAMAVAIGALMLLLLWGPDSLLALLRTSQLRWLGRVSYSVYLLHYPIMWTTGAALTHGHVRAQTVWEWLVIGTAGIGGTLLLSEYSYRYIEQPGRRLGGRLSSKVGSPPPQTGPCMEAGGPP